LTKYKYSPKDLKYVPKGNWARFLEKHKRELAFGKKFETSTNFGIHYFKSLVEDFYPRLHFIVMFTKNRRNNFVKIDLHVDYEKHRTDQFHPAVEKTYLELHNI